MIQKALYYIPRVVTVLAIIFMGMFSLDSFGGNATVIKKVLGLLIHNIPVFILIGILIIAWKNELIGGILFIIATLAGCVFYKSFSGNPGSLVVISPFFITGVLFILYHFIYVRDKEK